MQIKSKSKIATITLLSLVILSFGGQSWTQASAIEIEAEKQNAANFQANLDGQDLAVRIHELNFPGYVGLKLKPETKAADLWLSEDPSPELIEVLRDSKGFNVTLHKSPFTEAQLEGAIEKINELVRSSTVPGGIVLSSSSAREDGRGVDLTIDVASKVPDLNWVSSLSEYLSVPVFIDPDKTNIELTSTRLEDSAPWRGGSLFSTTDAYDGLSFCSQGFGVQSKVTDIQYMLTARHCFRNKSQILKTPQNSITMGTWNPATYYNSPINDAALTIPQQGVVRNSVYYGNLTTSNAYQVTSVGDNTVGLKVCTNGANSGLHCDVVIRQGPHSAYAAGMVYNNVVTGSKSNNQVTAVQGDSGGPVVSQLGSSGRLQGFGIIHAITSIGNCDNFSIQHNVGPVECGREVFWIDLSSALLDLHMQLK